MEGRRISKVVPRPGSLAAVIYPLLWTTKLWTIARPKPVPSPALFVVKNGSKIRASVALSILFPLSATRSLANLPER